MKEIITKGKNSPDLIRLTCHHCNCAFDVDNDEFYSDLEHPYSFRTKCPCCGSEVSWGSAFYKKLF